jgi:NhaP-type Na+/H+ or K+/H+ antiporter
MGLFWYSHGTVHPQRTLGAFLYSAGGGIIVGLLLAMFLVWFNQLLIRQPINYSNRDYRNTPAKIFYLLTPVFIYYLAEKIGVSGIIAVVCAGLVHSAGAERSRLTNPEVLYDTSSVVALLTDALNGTVFVILGMAMARFGIGHWHQPTLNWLWLGLLLYLANLFVRYLYGRIAHHLNNFHAWVFALGGVHGAVNFALAYTVASSTVVRQDANLVIMSISATILVSLLVPTFLFRFILPRETGGRQKDALVEKIRQKMVQKAIAKIEKIYLPEHLRRLVLFDLQAQKNDTTMREFTKQWLIDVRQPDLTPEERTIFFQAYRLAFQTELDFLSEIEQQDQQVEAAIVRLSREVLMAEILIFDNTNN